MPNKRVSVYLNDEDLQLLEAFCRSHNCSQSSALKSLLYRTNNEPTAPARADPVTEDPPKVYPGEIVFHESQIDKEERLRKEALEKKKAEEKAKADNFIRSIFNSGKGGQ